MSAGILANVYSNEFWRNVIVLLSFSRSSNLMVLIFEFVHLCDDLFVFLFIGLSDYDGYLIVLCIFRYEQTKHRGERQPQK